MKKVILSMMVFSSVTLMSCEKNIPDNGNDYHGTSIRLNNPNYGTNPKSYNEGEVGRHAICNGSFDWGRNFGNSWSFNEFDNTNINHYEKYYSDSIGYIEFGEGGIGELVFVNQDSISINVPFTYEIVGKDRNNHYYQIDWEDVKIRTYVRYENGGEPLATFNYTYMGEMSFDNGVDIYKWEGSMNDFDGVYSWGGNYVSYFNNDFTNCYK